MPEIKSDGLTIYFHTAGESKNPPVLFVHGWLANHRLWETTIDILKDRYFCIAPDILGHGESDVSPDADYSIEAQAAHMLAVIDHLQIDKFSMVGFSMGGQITGYIAGKLAPQRVIKWVHVDGAITGKFTPPMLLRKPMFWLGQYMPFSFDIARRLMSSRALARLLYADILYHDFNRVDFDHWGELHRAAYRTRYAKPYARIQTAIQRFNLLDVAANVKAETLVMAGVHDRVVPITELRQLAAVVPGAKIIEFEHYGHEIMAEGFKDYIETLQSFLQ